MQQVKIYFLNLRALDLLVVVFASLLSITNIIFYDKVDNWFTHVILNSIVTFLVFLITYYDKNQTNIFWQQLHFWYIVPLIFLSFKEIYFMLHYIRPNDYDELLIQIDRFIFGVDPTVVLSKISNPLITELLQIVYGTFFFLPIILGIDLLLHHRENEFHFGTFCVVLGFFLSFVGYFILPAVGPRFTIHNFEMTNTELPGIFLTNYLREIVNAGESIPAGTINPAFVVQRDVFPSGHTQMTLIVMYLSVKLKTGTRYFFIPNGSLLIFSTVYLRYHYVIDLIAGAIFMILTMVAGKIIYNWWMKIKGEKLFDYAEN